MRNKSKYKASREKRSADTENVDAIADLEQKLTAALANGTLKEGSPLYLKVKQQIKLSRDSLNLNRRRSP